MKELDYDARFLMLVRLAPRARRAVMLREKVESSESWTRLEHAVWLHVAFDFFSNLPEWPHGAARHLPTMKRFEDGPGAGRPCTPSEELRTSRREPAIQEGA